MPDQNSAISIANFIEHKVEVHLMGCHDLPATGTTTGQVSLDVLPDLRRQQGGAMSR